MILGLAGGLFEEWIKALEEAVQRRGSRLLSRLARREGVAAEEALREISAFPSRDCSAWVEGAILASARCSAGKGCPVEMKCPWALEGGAAAIRRCRLGQFIEQFLLRKKQTLPAPPFSGLAALIPEARALLERSGKAGPKSPERVRTAPAVLEKVVLRGGILGVTGPFLTLAELELVAAFIPPGSGRGDPHLAEVEGWIRRAVSQQLAVVEFPAS